MDMIKDILKGWILCKKERMIQKNDLFNSTFK